MPRLGRLHFVVPSDTHTSETMVGAFSWRDWVPSHPRPVLALGARRLFLLMVKGSGFSVPAAGGGPPIQFFLTVRIVSAHDLDEADRLARERVASDWWTTSAVGRLAGPAIVLQATHIERLSARFRLRSSFAFVLLTTDKDESTEEQSA